MPKLHVVVCSTRPGRKGLHIGKWFHEFARQHGGFEVELVDLHDFNLPVYDEPEHPRLKKYQNEHTLKWSASVAAADAFVFVTPEYNHGTPPALLNALNYVYQEWNYKPAAFVSYGGLSGGMRAVQMEKLTLNTLKMVPLLEAVNIPNFAAHIENDRFKAEAIHNDAAKIVLDELLRWANALRPLRG